MCKQLEAAVSVRWTLAVGLAAVAIAAALVLAAAPARVAGTNLVAPRSVFADLGQGEGACQAEETLPRATSALRVNLEAVVGPSVTVTVSSPDGRVLARGARGSGWTGGNVTVPLGEPLERGVSRGTVCFSIGATRERVMLLGQPSPAGSAVLSSGAPGSGRVGIAYLAPGTRSWWSLALPVARRMGLGRAPSGSWIAPAVALAMLLTAALGLAVAVRELGPDTPRRPRRLLAGVPTAAWACALVALLNAACWSEISPPFQTPDEPAHFAYVQQLAEAHRLPRHGTEYSPEEEVALADLHHNAVQFVPGSQTISSRAEQRTLEQDLAQGYPRVGPGEAGTAASEPPLFYALQIVPYELGSSGSLLDRLQLMRLLSAVFGGLTALFAFVFAREALPGAGWAWTVAGLGVAFAPLLGMMSGAVTPDSLLFALSAALFYLLARAFRRGLTLRLAGAIGATIAAGCLTKLNFLGLLPGTLVALTLLAVRAPEGSRRAVRIAVGVTCALGALPALAYAALDSPAGPLLSALPSSAGGTASHGSTLGEISYMWQLFLPRLPGMSDYFPGVSSWRQLWFDGLVGLYGWADTMFPVWVYQLALVPAAGTALLCGRALVRARGTLGARVGELVSYALMAAGVLVLVGGGSYTSDVIQHVGPFWEPRYLLPMLPLFGVLLALAARGAGRRFGPAAGMALVVLVLAHDVFSQLLVVSRYYG
jgi:Predicted membrane protein (DUF2142)